jgi:septal ring factor EnvC (AmiA/AmiB activator)
MSDDTREMYAELFKGVSATTVEVPLLKETLRDARALIEQEKWDETEGLQIIFANGLYYLREERSLSKLSCDHDALAREVERLTRDLMDMHSMYAVMKYRAYTLSEAKQGLEFNITGLEVENRWSTSRLWQFRADEEEMRKELDALRTQNERLRQRLAQFEEPTVQVAPLQAHKPLLARVLGVFRR